MIRSEESLSRDQVFDLLSNSRRRMALYCLRQQAEPMSITDLAREIAAIENGVDVQSVTKKQQKRVYVSLYQTHVPKMTEAGLLEWDRDASTIRLAEGAYEVDAYIRPVHREDYPWSAHYLGLALGGALLYFAFVFELVVVDGLSSFLIGVLVILLIGLSAGVHLLIWYQRRRRLPPEFEPGGEA